MSYIGCLRLSACLGLLGLASCRPEPIIIPQNQGFKNGIFITNEGIFNQTSGSVTFYNPNTDSVYQDIFRQANNRDLGNVVQSLAFHDARAYIVVNNSNKIEIVNDSTWAELGQITGLAMPRYILPLGNGLAYVSQWGNDGLTGSVQVVDLQTFQIVSSIPLYKGSERMLAHGQDVWVCNVGGYDHDHRLAIINTATHTLDTTILLPFDDPHGIATDRTGNIWVACSGKIIYSNYPDVDTARSTAPALVCINPVNRQITQQIVLPKGASLQDLTVGAKNSNLFYFTYQNKIYQFNSQTLSYAPLMGAGSQGNYYGLGIDTIRQNLYAAKYEGITPATILQMDMQGNVQDSFKAGVFANDFYAH